MALRCWTLTSLLSLILTGCYQGAGIDYTIPADGETEVDADTSITVGFTQNMDSETVGDASNYVVRGSISGEHEITASYDSETQALTITSAGGDGSGGGVPSTPSGSATKRQ